MKKKMLFASSFYVTLNFFFAIQIDYYNKFRDTKTINAFANEFSPNLIYCILVKFIKLAQKHHNVIKGCGLNLCFSYKFSLSLTS